LTVILVPSTAEERLDIQTQPRALEPKDIFAHSQTLNQVFFKGGLAPDLSP